MPNVTTTAHRDPVCGMTVDEEKAAGTSEYGSRTYYFCSASCLTKFKADPNRYVKQPTEAAAPAPLKQSTQQVEYTCPMHPEVRQMGPGTCPKLRYGA
jgi:Cu+-exporting ATPase